MGIRFHQLTHDNRVAISTLLKAGHSKDKIAKQLGFHRSTIYRVIARNSSKLGYLPFIAETKVQTRKKRNFKLTKNHELRKYIFDKLSKSWSPEQIAGRLKLENQGKSLICHETIYAYIYSDYGIRNKYYRYLREKRNFRYPKVGRKNRISIPNRVSIHQRSQEANDRIEIGHWEADLMHFNRGTNINFITLRERQSRYMIAIKNKNKKSETTAEKIVNALTKFKGERIKTMTFDNGFEFAKHEKISEKLRINTYFCDPYKSYQKGSIENGNKQLREWFPRDINSSLLIDEMLKNKIKLLNQRPMKCLNFYTPTEKFLNRSGPI